MSLFNWGTFKLHSGKVSNIKIDCDALSDESIAAIAKASVEHLPRISGIEGVPTGGLRFAEALKREWADGFYEGYPVLIVDDVCTTGASLEEHRKNRYAVGLVLFARGPCPPWVKAWFTAHPEFMS